MINNSNNSSSSNSSSSSSSSNNNNNNNNSSSNNNNRWISHPNQSIMQSVRPNHRLSSLSFQIDPSAQRAMVVVATTS